MGLRLEGERENKKALLIWHLVLFSNVRSRKFISTEPPFPSFYNPFRPKHIILGPAIQYVFTPLFCLFFPSIQGVSWNQNAFWRSEYCPIRSFFTITMNPQILRILVGVFCLVGISDSQTKLHNNLTKNHGWIHKCTHYPTAKTEELAINFVRNLYRALIYSPLWLAKALKVKGPAAGI